MSRDKLRTALLDKRPRRKHVDFKFRGETFRVLEPSVKDLKHLLKLEKNSDELEYTIEAMFMLLVEPETGNFILEPADKDSIMNSPLDSELINSFTTALGKLTSDNSKKN